MRIIAGVARGRAVQAPRGTATRPTSDRVREAIFDVLAARAGHASAGGEGELGTRVLDLFAGSGALSLEALSRGAASAVLVDHSGTAIAAAVHNAAALGLRDRVRTLRLDAFQALLRLLGEGAVFDRVFLDPPYAGDTLARALAALGGPYAALLAGGAVVVAEHARRVEPPAAEGALELLVRHRYGDTAVSFYRKVP